MNEYEIAARELAEAWGVTDERVILLMAAAYAEGHIQGIRDGGEACMGAFDEAS